MIKNSEEYIQIYLVSFLKKLQATEDFLFWHTPNGGSRDKREAGKFKLMGMLAGVPDLCIMAKNTFHFIELKKNNGGLSKAQEEFIDKAMGLGFSTSTIFADSVEDALYQLCQILEEVFFFDQKGMSKSSSSVLSANP